jgi:hypothetical protein
MNMKTYTEEEMTAAINKAHADGKTVGVTEGATTGATAERTRISAIVNSDEAKGKLGTALALALGEDAVSPATAAAVLKTVKTEEAGAGAGNAFERAMDNTPNPNAGAEAGAGGEQSVAHRILATFNKAAGTDYGPKTVRQ